MENEIWMPIPGYDGIYNVSNMGRVKNLARRVNRSRGGTQVCPERILKPHINNGNGYAIVHLSNLGIHKTCYVHRLVMSAFCGVSSLVVDHINGSKFDNRLSNLRYCTQRDNLGFNKPQLGVEVNNFRYRSRINVSGKLLHLGVFNNIEDAKNAYLIAKSKLQ